MRLSPATALIYQVALSSGMKDDQFQKIWATMVTATGVDSTDEPVLREALAGLTVRGDTVFLPSETVALLHHAATELPADEPFSLECMPFEGACVFLETPLTYCVEGFEPLVIEALIMGKVHDDAFKDVRGYAIFAYTRLDFDSVMSVRGIIMDLGVAITNSSVTGLYGVNEDDDRGLCINLRPFVHALWNLAATPMMESTTVRPIEPAARKTRKKLASGGNVRVVGLRHRPGNAKMIGSSERVYTQRWVVRGHWRKQREKRVWVRSHIKGPSDAPLMLNNNKVYKVQA